MCLIYFLFKASGIYIIVVFWYRFQKSISIWKYFRGALIFAIYFMYTLIDTNIYLKFHIHVSILPLADPGIWKEGHLTTHICTLVDLTFGKNSPAGKTSAKNHFCIFKMGTQTSWIHHWMHVLYTSLSADLTKIITS